MSGQVKLIALMGTESTGKTTLCAQLARELRGLWVPEYIRDFCLLEGRPPRIQEQLAMMDAQSAREDAALEAARRLGMQHVFCDTTPLMTAIYSELLFNDASHIPFALRHQQHYALTLFTQPDIGWLADGVRDGAHVQPVVTALIEKHLCQAGQFPFVRVSGIGQARLDAALQALGSIRA